MEFSRGKYFTETELAVVERIISLENDIYKEEPQDSKNGDITATLKHLDDPAPKNVLSLGRLMNEQSFDFLKKLCAFMYFGRDYFEHQDYSLEESYKYVRDDLKLKSKEVLADYMLEKGPEHLSNYLTKAIERYYG